MATQQQARLSLPPGTRFGRYEVITEIASGGMATVFLGRALGAAGFQRLVAVKVMHPHVAKDEDFVGMFMDEARLAARIRHPNVVATLDLENDQQDGLYLIMEYIEGDGLLSLFRHAMKSQKPMPPSVTIRIVLDMLNGLHAAHELTGDRGEPLRLVHRDVSPHNVLVGVDGIARITDFGIARAEERISATRDGQIKGKLAYMAPEQTSGTPVDRRADLFATGVVLWECLTNRRLFAGANDGEVLRNLLVNPIKKLREVAPELPASLEEVCNKALERDPVNRYTSAAQFAEELEEAGGAVGIASVRAVSKYVREVSGNKINAMQQRVRGLMPDSSGATSAVRSIKRSELTDPDKTTQHTDSGLRIDPNELVEEKSEKSASKSLAVPTSVAVASESPLTTDVGITSQAVPQQQNRSKGVWAVLGVVVLLAAVGVGVMLTRGSSSGTTNQPQTNRTAPTTNTPPPSGVQPSVAAQNPGVVPVPTPEHQAETADAGAAAVTGSNAVNAQNDAADAGAVANNANPTETNTVVATQQEPTNNPVVRPRRNTNRTRNNQENSGGNNHTQPTQQAQPTPHPTNQQTGTFNPQSM